MPVGRLLVLVRSIQQPRLVEVFADQLQPDRAVIGAEAGRDVRARRGGHIPGAINVEWSQNLRPDLTFRPIEELRAIYASKGITPDKTIVTYCQTHSRASHTYFVLRLLGYPRLLAYDRSWVEWGNRDDLPVAR